MSKFGWRWWELGKDGSLQSINHIIWPPGDVFEAECEFQGYRFGVSHRWYLEKPNGGLIPMPRDMDIPTHLKDSPLDGGILRQEGVPAARCGCGCWAFWDPDLASGLPHTSFYHRACKVFGVIEGWGDIVEHELGFRCQYATIRGLVVTRGRLHGAYDIVQQHRSIEEMVNVWDDGGASESSGEVIEIIDPDA